MENTICRVCGVDLDRYSGGIFIFKAKGIARNLLSKISSCLPIIVSKDDACPKIVCKQCATQLDLFFEFQERSKETEIILKNKFTIGTAYLDNTVIKQESDDTNWFSDNHQDDKFLKRSKINEDNLNKEHQEFVFCEPLITVKEETVSGTCDEPSQPIHEELDSILSLQTLESDFTARNSIAFSSAENLDMTKIDLIPNIGQNNNKMKVIYQCAYCNLNFESHDTSETHILQNHYQERQNRVSSNAVLQQQTVGYFKKLSTNIGAVAPQKTLTKTTTMFRCTYCKQLFPTREESANHILEEHKKERQERFALTEIKQNASCAADSSSLPESKNTLKDYKQEVTVFRCTYCKMLFTTQENTKTHIEKEHKKLNKCDHCQQIFPTSEALSIHEQSCWIQKVQKQKVKNVKCDFCGSKYFDKHDFKTHFFKSHLCKLCGKIYKDPYGDALRYHRKSHKTQKIPICKPKNEKCLQYDAKFFSKVSLTALMKKHTGDLLPYECNICPKKYKSRQSLKNHLILHSGTKTFICQTCGKAFAMKNYLLVHQRNHTGERPYGCDICGRRFKQRCALKVHSKLHK